MPTAAEWIGALGRQRTVTVASSPDLLADVAAMQGRRNAKLAAAGRALEASKPLAVVAGLSPLRVLEITPGYLLHRLAVATTPVVANLADICSMWAHIRYLWAFDPAPDSGPPSALRLSQEALDIDFHQKALLSDQIGVGMAAVVMETCFSASVPVDVSEALHDPTWPIERGGTASPDYLFVDSSGESYIVECKGSQGTKHAVMDQLRRGSEQVRAVRFTDGRAALSLVVASHLSRAGIVVYVLDPPDEPDNAETGGGILGDSPKVRKVEDREQIVRRSRLLAQARLLAFSGDMSASHRRLLQAEVVSKRPLRTAPPRITTRENALGAFSGFSVTVGVFDQVVVEAFQGMEIGALEKLSSADDPGPRGLTVTDGNERRAPRQVATESSFASRGPDDSYLEIIAKDI